MTQSDQDMSDSLRYRLMQSLKAVQPPPPWTLTDALITLLASGIALLIISTTVASIIAGDLSTPAPGAWLIGWSIGLILLIGFVLISRRRTPAEFQALTLQPGRLPLPYLVLLGVAIALTADVIVGLVTQQFAVVAPLRGGISGTDWLIAGLFMIVLQPIAEGLVFMGVVLPRLRASLSPVGGYLAMAVAYTLLYALVYGALLPPAGMFGYGVLLPLLLSLAYGWLRLYTGSTRDTIVAMMGGGLALLLSALVLLGA